MRVVELAAVLREHFEGESKHGPRFAVDGVCVAHGVDVWPRFMHGRVDKEAGCVGRARPVPADDLTIKIDENHVACFQQAEVHAEGVCPEGIRVLRITDRDVSRYTFDIAFARPVPEGGGHVFELPLTLGGEGGEFGDSREGDIAMGDCLQG